MTIKIFKDQGGELNPDDYEPVSEYDPEAEEWLVDEAGYEQFYPAGTDPEVILAQLDGPAAIAVEEDA